MRPARQFSAGNYVIAVESHQFLSTMADDISSLSYLGRPGRIGECQRAEYTKSAAAGIKNDADGIVDIVAMFDRPT